jgi:hypothetical protein
MDLNFYLLAFAAMKITSIMWMGVHPSAIKVCEWVNQG